MNFLRNFIRFSRLHTVVGTTLSITALWAIALSFAVGKSLYLNELALTLVSCLGANIYIVGLNQITDVDIDRINKPYLPLASGAFSMRLGKWIVGLSVAVSLAIALWMGKYLLLTVLLSLALGTAYSVRPFRLKRFTFWAAFCIIAVRGLIVNLLLFLHFHDLMSGVQTVPPLVWLLTGVIFVFSIVIAWFKDIPDMEGDRRFHIRTLSLRLGGRTVFRTGNALLSLSYVALIVLPFLFAWQIDEVPFAVAHAVFLLALWLVAYRVDLENLASVRWYYQFVWVLFFLEYGVFAGAALLG